MQIGELVNEVVEIIENCFFGVGHTIARDPHNLALGLVLLTPFINQLLAVLLIDPVRKFRLRHVQILKVDLLSG